MTLNDVVAVVESILLAIDAPTVHRSVAVAVAMLRPMPKQAELLDVVVVVVAVAEIGVVRAALHCAILRIAIVVPIRHPKSHCAMALQHDSSCCLATTAAAVDATFAAAGSILRLAQMNNDATPSSVC